MTEQAHLKVKNDLYNIVSNLAYQDYYRKNHHPNGKRKKKKHNPYCLSCETEEALEIYTVACKETEEITREEEEKIKAYLVKFRFYRPEYLNPTKGMNKK